MAMSVTLSDQSTAVGEPRPLAIEARKLNVYYGGFHAVKDVDLAVERNKITALIGPSGCGKSTVLRSFNRMNDLIPIARIEGEVAYHGRNLYDRDVDPVEVRRHIGMVFQKPNPFPKSIYENIAWGAKINGYRGNMDELVERCLRGAALWDEVKDKLKQNAYGLSGGQQQRLCIARAIATRPDIILMDEPCSALDPIATLAIEDLMKELVENYTIIIVTHNMQQAARVSDYHGLLHGRFQAHRLPGRVRPHAQALHPARPQGDRGLHHGAVRMTWRRVLILCTGNSCRSQMAEGLVNARLAADWRANPRARGGQGMSIPWRCGSCRNGEWACPAAMQFTDEFLGNPFNLVIRVCDGAAEDCPVWLGTNPRAHIGFPDPAHAVGSEDERLAVFRQVRDDMAQRIVGFLEDFPQS